ncbi:MAG: hypothetical protein HKN12_00845 [Gemmatimonadetes bacterium]|nr:hypothetical protein [Gemmatimonadota bacterium]
MRVAEGLWLVGRPGEAIDILRPLTRGDQKLIAPRVLLAWCLEDDGREAEAEVCRRDVAALDPSNPYGVTGAVPDAAPDDDDVPEDELQAEPERALSEAELRAVPPGPLYSATLAEIFAKQGFQEKAIEIYREIERADPDRPDVQQRIRSLEEQLEGGGA